MTAAALALHGLVSYRRVLAARRDHERARAVFDTGAELQRGGRSSAAWYCQSSESLCEAECSMPVANDIPPHRAHLDRMWYAEARTEALQQVITNGSSLGRDLRMIRNYRVAAQRWLEEHDR